MKFFFLKVLLITAFTLVAAIFTLINLRLPIRSDYWLRDSVIVKQHIAQNIKSPKIIILGGSSVLFGFNASQIEKELQIPTVNFGMNAFLRHEYFTRIAKASIKPGDILVIAYENRLYEENNDWIPYALRNSIAWDYPTLDSKSTEEKLKIYYKCFSKGFLKELSLASYQSLFGRKEIVDALRTPDQVLAAYQEYQKHPLAIPDESVYVDTYKGLSPNGDMWKIDNVKWTGTGTEWRRPEKIHPEIKAILSDLIQEMKSKNVRVYFACAPYMLDGQQDTTDSRTTEEAFAKEIRELGSEIIDKREQLRFSRDMFYDTQFHLNARGREIRTKLFVDCMRPRIAALRATEGATAPAK